MAIHNQTCTVVWWLLGMPNWPYKSSSQEVLGRAFVSLATLQTMVIEIDAHLNNRPLSSEIDDLNSLSPAHLLLWETRYFVTTCASG